MMDKRKCIAETIETYNIIAEDYYKTHSSIYAIKKFADFVDFFIRNLNGRRILDVGCGPGRDTRHFSDHGFEVIGIDMAHNFLKIASRNAPNARFIKMDMRNLGFPNDAFDGIWVAGSFYHIPKEDAKATLLEFNRVLKPGGLVHISLKIGDGEKVIRKKEDKGRIRFYAFYGENEFKDMIKSCNFKIVKSEISKEKDLDNISIENTWMNIFATKQTDGCK